MHARRRAVPRKAVDKPYKAFHSDEHPEVPKIRRASLKQGRAEMHPANNYEQKDEDVSRTGRSGQTPSRPMRRQPRSEMHPFTGLEERREARPQQRSGRSGSRYVAQRRQAEIPPFTGLEEVQEARTSPKTRSTYAQLRTNTSRRLPAPGLIHRVRQGLSAPFWQHRKRWILLGALAFLLLVFTPLMIGLAQNRSGQQSSGSSSTTSSIPISKLQSIPSNSHELVILPPKTDHPAPPVLATSAYLLDTSNETTLYAQNPFVHLPMLSTTKLMTATLAVETGNLNQQITITPAMERDINQLSADSALFGVKQGETYTLRDLLYGLLYFSGNDAALVIADALGGSISHFVEEMNQKAQTLGMNDTHFVNPHGLLDPGQYSCARDLAVLGQYSLSIPALQQISRGKTYHIAAGGKHGERVLLNENQFLWWFPGVDGGKTGFDGVSDFVQVMSVTRNNHHLIGVVIHTNNWWTDMRNLMNYGFNSYTWISPHDVDASGQPIPYDNLWNYFASDTTQVSVSLSPGQRYYVYSGYTVSGAILTYFDKNGGLKKFGFPMKAPTPSNNIGMIQQFQHGSILCNLSTNQCNTV